MKKLFLFLAVAGLISFAACKSGETKSDATADSTKVEVAADSTDVIVADTATEVK